MMIHVRDVVKIEQSRREIKKAIYIKIFEQFSRKIKQAVQIGSKYTRVVVPIFLFGYPTFDRAKAADYLKRQLVLAEFTVSEINPFEFYISWKVRKPKEEKPVAAVSFVEEVTDFPTMINLKKAANKYRRG